MMWSKLKHLTEGKFADSVKNRVEIFSTRYNKPNSSTGRGGPCSSQSINKSFGSSGQSFGKKKTAGISGEKTSPIGYAVAGIQVDGGRYKKAFSILKAFSFSV